MSTKIELPEGHVPTAMKALPCHNRSFHSWFRDRCIYCGLRRDEFNAAYARRRKWVSGHPEFREPRNKIAKESEQARADRLGAENDRLRDALSRIVASDSPRTMSAIAEAALGGGGVGQDGNAT